MSHFVIVNSDQCKEYFPNNTPYKFKSQLKVPLLMKGQWKVGVVEVDISSSLGKTEPLYLHSNVCMESVLDGEEKPILRRLTAASGGDWSNIFTTPFYLPVKGNIIYEIELYLTDEEDNLQTFLNQTSTVTLHFQALPFV